MGGRRARPGNYRRLCLGGGARGGTSARACIGTQTGAFVGGAKRRGGPRFLNHL